MKEIGNTLREQFLDRVFGEDADTISLVTPQHKPTPPKIKSSELSYSKSI
jgi:hypothetical protein